MLDDKFLEDLLERTIKQYGMENLLYHIIKVISNMKDLSLEESYIEYLLENLQFALDAYKNRNYEEEQENA